MGDGRLDRNAERTRAALLKSAAEGVSERGSGVSLAYIAKRAGVSKGGLLHHFPTREKLFVALASDAEERLRQNVLDHVDLSENTPGKLLRAYVRALTSQSEDTRQYFTSAPVWIGIYQIPDVEEMSRQAVAWWDENLAADGMSPERILIVRRAAEGIAVALAHGDKSAEDAEAAQRTLLRLADGGEIDDD